MSNGINKVILIGNVGQDPDFKELTGFSVANLSLATSKKVKEETVTQWHKLVFFNKLALLVKEYVKKGSKLYVEGEISYRKWQDKEGNDKYSTEIQVHSLQFLGDAKVPATEGREEVYDKTKVTSRDSAQAEINDFDDDIPF